MAIAFPAITQPYSNTPIMLAYADGSLPLVFADIREPSTLPEFTYADKDIKVTTTRPSANSPGFRLFRSLGSAANMTDLDLEVPILLAADKTQLVTWYNNRTQFILITIDGGTNCYYGLFKKGGLEFKNYQWNQRSFCKGILKFYIVTTATDIFQLG